MFWSPAFIATSSSRSWSKIPVLIDWNLGNFSVKPGSLIIGNKSSVQVGQGVFVGTGKGSGSVPLDNPNAPNKTRCAIVDAGHGRHVVIIEGEFRRGGGQLAAPGDEFGDAGRLEEAGGDGRDGVGTGSGGTRGTGRALLAIVAGAAAAFKADREGQQKQ